MLIPEDVKLTHYELILNEDCNLRCKYCFDDIYSKRSGKVVNTKMSIEMMDEIIDFINKTRNVKEITRITFFGGEPMTNWEFIEEFLKRGEKIGYKIDYTMVTNGTLFNKDRIDTLLNHNVGIAISIDGNRSSNDLNRVFKDGSGSYGAIMKTLPTLIGKAKGRNKNSIGAMMVVNDKTYKQFKENYETLTNIFGKQRVTILYTYETLNDDMLLELEEQMVETFLNKNEPLTSAHTRYLQSMNSGGCGSQCSTEKRFCHSPKQTVTINPRGDLFFCHRFVPKLYDISEGFDQYYGNIKDGWINKKYFDRKWELTTAPGNLKYLEGCNDCECFAWCSGGCSAVHWNGSGRNRDDILFDNFCKIQKIINKIITTRSNQNVI